MRIRWFMVARGVFYYRGEKYPMTKYDWKNGGFMCVFAMIEDAHSISPILYNIHWKNTYFKIYIIEVFKGLLWKPPHI